MKQKPAYPSDVNETHAANLKAVMHLIERVHVSAELRHHIGFGSESFELLAQAGAFIYGEQKETLYEYLMGRVKREVVVTTDDTDGHG